MRMIILLVLTLCTLAAAKPASADLRSFFHGEPAAPPKAPPPKQLAVVSSAAGVAADPQIESFFRSLADALKARDSKPALARLSERFSIDDLPDGFKPARLFAQAVETTAGPTEIVIKAVEKQNNIRSAKVELRYEAGKTKEKVFRFDAAGLLLWTDWFQIKVQRSDS